MISDFEVQNYHDMQNLGALPIGGNDQPWWEFSCFDFFWFLRK